jgi:hypothetical protein
MKFNVSAFSRLRKPVVHLFVDVLVGQALFELVAKIAKSDGVIATGFLL